MKRDIELIVATIDAEFSEIAAAAAGWEDVLIEGESVSLLGRHEPALSGPLVLATIHPGERAALSELSVNSRERFDHVCASWYQRTGKPLPILEENIHPFDSNPEGREVRVDSSILEGDGAAFQEQQAKTWLDQPIPTLGDLTPRQAAADGRTTEVRALLPQDLGSKEVARLRETLGLPGQPRAPWQEKGAQP